MIGPGLLHPFLIVAPLWRRRLDLSSLKFVKVGLASYNESADTMCIMKNPNAVKLVAAAAKYRDALVKNSMYVEAKAVALQDYEDLVSIAQMIENNESGIARAMWRLDTAVRDVIPDSVYDTYNK
mgnify:CR=1 FL=1